MAQAFSRARTWSREHWFGAMNLCSIVRFLKPICAICRLLSANISTCTHIDQVSWGRLILSCDHAKFLNHSDDPNTSEVPFGSIASRPIAVGDEITCDYRAFCTDGKGFDD